MMHIAKYTNAQAYKLIDHYNRKEEKERERSNENIDKTRTQYNLNLMQRDKTPQEFYKERLNEVFKLNRADIKSMIDIIITLPKDYQGEKIEFFEKTVNFFNDRYGAENCIGAFLHLDETTPHLHYCFLPITPDKDPKHEQSEKLNAKGIFTRKELKTLHPDLQEYLRERLQDKNINIYTDRDEKRQNLDMKDYKLKKREEEQQRKEQELQKREAEQKRKERELQKKEEAQRGREKETERKEKEINNREAKAEKYGRYYEAVEKYKEFYDLSDSNYYMSIYTASQGLNAYPLPEALNPDRTKEQRAEIIKDYEHEQEREAERTR